MVDLNMYQVKYLNTGKITPDEYFMNTYLEEVFESQHVRTSTKKLCTILDAKHKKSDLN